jgi:hypothetical protein
LKLGYLHKDFFIELPGKAILRKEIFIRIAFFRYTTMNYYITRWWEKLRDGGILGRGSIKGWRAYSLTPGGSF